MSHHRYRHWMTFWGLGLLLTLLLLAGCGTAMPSQPVRPPGDAAQAALADDALAGLAHDEELWIIAADEADRPDASRGVRVGGGVAHLRLGPTRLAALPVADVRVHAVIGAELAAVHVHQRFRNPHDEPGQVIYEFALPVNARVHEFVLIVGERRIRGVIRPRAEAFSLYGHAREQGYRASLLAMTRPGRFSHRLTQLMPGQSLAVMLQYRQPTTGEVEWRRFALPAALVEAARDHAGTDATEPARALTLALMPGLADLELTATAHSLRPVVHEADGQPAGFGVAFDPETRVSDLNLRYRVHDAATAASAAGRHFPHDVGLGGDDAFITIDATGPAGGRATD